MLKGISHIFGRVALLLLLLAGTATANDTLGEYQVKGAFLFNFVKFVEWPADALGEPGEPLTICVIGNNPFGTTLKELEGKTVKGRPVKVREITAAAEAEGCQELFISATTQGEVAAILANLPDEPILTVSDNQRFSRAGGMIQFLTTDAGIRFEVNNGAAKEAGLKISSMLLRLALTVRE
jgi:hypothetical protein